MIVPHVNATSARGLPLAQAFLSCNNAIVRVEIKTIGNSGQISLGKENAGRTVMVEQVEAGVWMIRTAQVIPDNELWLHEPAARESLDKALEWSSRSKRSGSDLATLARRIKRGK
jgi:hypothetical protein